MAGHTWLRFARDSQRYSRLADLDHHVHDNDFAHGTIRFVLNQLDVHDEFHYTVWIGRKVTTTSKQANWTLGCS